MLETEGLIKQGMNSTTEGEYRNLSKGTDTSGLLNTPDSLNGSLSFGDHALSSAIKSKYSKPFQVQQQGMQNKMQLDSRNSHFQKILTAHQLANEEANMNFQKEMIKYKQKMAKRQQRQQLVGQTLGLVGGVIGGMAGGPAGASAGMAGGQGVGTAYTNSNSTGGSSGVP